MKKTGFFFYLLLAVVFILQSCSVEKRLYTSGFYVRHFTSPSKKSTSSLTRETTVNISEVKRKVLTEEIRKKESKKHLLATVSPAQNSLPSLQNLKPTFKAIKDSCDTLVLADGTEILTRILEIGPNVLRYKHCDNPNGPVYVVNASEVSMIIFSNGSIEEFKNEETPVPSTVVSEENPYLVSPSKIEKTSRYAIVFGVLAIPTLIAYLAGVMFAILAIKNGSAALRWYNRDPRSFDPRIKMRAQAGMILGYLTLALLLFGIIALIMIELGLLVI